MMRVPPLVIRAKKQRCSVAVMGPVWPGGECGGLVDGMTVPEPIEHSVVGVPNEGENSSVDCEAVPDLIEHSGVRVSADPHSAGQLIMHLEASGDWENGRQDHTSDNNTPLDVRTEDKRLSPDDGEAIVVGAVGSAAPWFLTGWAEEVEIEFMFDTGCQVTILATSVFERMCASDPQVRSRLRPCGRRLISAESSPLTVKGELEMTIVFRDYVLHVISCGQHRIRWPAGYGSHTIVLATSAGLANGAIVGGRSIDVTVTPTETCS